jgi:hypothetical protein
MAAKKKMLKTETEEKISTKTNSLAYQGRVKFQVLHGSKVISTKNYSNSGLPDLFKYLSHALAGVQYSALRPCKVAIFECSTKDVYADPTAFVWSDAVENKALVEASPYVIYDATPVVTTTATGSITTFRFKIPFNWLYRKTFNTLGLFTENNSPCAYYLFTTETGDGKKRWDPQVLTDITGNYSLVIEWAMEISNK